jgi:Domain of unknown function (DUF1906)
MKGLDYAGGKPGAAAIAAAGYRFVCRYLTDGGPELPGKLLTADEYADLQAHGISVVYNWESTADRMRSGSRAGTDDARRAENVIQRLGLPPEPPVFFSADFDATPHDQVAINAYLTAAGSVLGANRVGVYGSFYVVQRCFDAGTAAWGWQTGAWSGGQVEPRTHILQHIETVVINGVECDVNEALRLPNFGQHPFHERERDMNQLPATPMPTNPNSDPRAWPQRNFNIEFAPGENWVGVVAAQDWGGRTTDDVRGYLLLASWETPNGLVPVSPQLAVGGGGVTVRNHQPLAPFVAPPNATGLTLNYSAPGGGEVGV